MQRFSSRLVRILSVQHRISSLQCNGSAVDWLPVPTVQQSIGSLQCIGSARWFSIGLVRSSASVQFPRFSSPLVRILSVQHRISSLQCNGSALDWFAPVHRFSSHGSAVEWLPVPTVQHRISSLQCIGLVPTVQQSIGSHFIGSASD